MKKIDVLGLGIAPVDFFVSMNKYPGRGKKIDGLAESSLIAGGGPVPNSLSAFASLGGRAGVISAFGDDDWGKFARKELDKFGVGHKHCIIRKNCSSAMAFAWIEKTSGERTIVLDIPGRLYIKPGDIKLDSLPIPEFIHLDGRHMEACVKLARWGKKNKVKVMLDVGSVRNKVDNLFPYLDYLVCADEYALNYFKTKSIAKAVKSFKNLGIPEVVVTAGLKGSYGIDVEGVSHRQKAFKIKAVDTTGAGDAFHGGYLFGLLKKWNLPRKMEFASATAALKCLKPGARMGIPTYRQTVTFIKKHRIFHA